MTVRSRVAVLILCLVATLAGAVSAQDIQGPAGETYRKAQSAVASGQLDQARALLEQALKQVQGPMDGIVIAGLLAQVRASQGKYEEAKAYLATQAEKTRLTGYKVELARLILRVDPAGAGEAARLLKEVVDKEPKNVEGWIEYGRALARAGDYTESVRAYEQVTLNLARKELRAHYGLTETFILQGLFARARNNATNTLQINPEAPLSYVWLGKAYDRDRSVPGHYAAAIEQYERAYQLDKAQAMYLGHVLFNMIMSDNHEMAKAYGRKLSKHPADSVKFWFDGLLKELTGDIAGALALYQQAVAANPQNVYAHFALANVYSGDPTPGFGPVRGARVEGWRYAPHRDVRKAQQAVSMIKLMDPTFPFLSSLGAKVQERLAAEYPAPVTLDEQSAQRLNKMVNYFQHLQMTR